MGALTCVDLVWALWGLFAAIGIDAFTGSWTLYVRIHPGGCPQSPQFERICPGVCKCCFSRYHRIKRNSGATSGIMEAFLPVYTWFATSRVHMGYALRLASAREVVS